VAVPLGVGVDVGGEDSAQTSKFVVPNPTGWRVDFGACDGQVCSNTFNLVALTTSSGQSRKTIAAGRQTIVNDRDCEADLGATSMSTGPWRSGGVDVRRTANAFADIEIGHVDWHPKQL